MKILCKSLLCLTLYTSQALAQMPVPAGIAPVTVTSVGYSNMGRSASPSGRIGLNGLNASLTEDFSPRHGVTLEFGYLRASNVFGTGHSNDVVSYMVGPVFYPTRRHDLVVNVHVLAGGARVRGVVPLSVGGFAIGHVHDVAWAFGAGVEHWFSDSMALRVSVDAMHTSFYNSSQVVHGQYDLRTTASLVYYFGKHKRKRH
jgi:hypothetical protein